MHASTSKFIDGMKRKGIKYTYEGQNERTKKDIVKVRYSGDNMDTIEVQYFFNDDCEDAAIRVFNMCRVPKDKIAGIYRVISAQNNHYRFAKFCLDESDNTIQMEMDPVFRANDVAEICLELLSRSVNICDEAYTEFMKFIYS